MFITAICTISFVKTTFLSHLLQHTVTTIIIVLVSGMIFTSEISLMPKHLQGCCIDDDDDDR